MSFSQAHPMPMTLRSEEMLEISQDISLRFSPVALLAIDEAVELTKNIAPPPTKPKPEILYTHPTTAQPFSSNELLSISNNISQQHAPQTTASIPELLLLPVDPYHLYAYWEWGSAFLTEQPPDQPYMVRIYWRTDRRETIKSSNVWLDVPADNLRQCQQIRLPMDNSLYSAALGILDDQQNFTAYAYSNIIQVPAQEMPVNSWPPEIEHDNDANTIQPQVLVDAGAPANEVKAIEDSQANLVPFSEPGWSVKLHFSPPQISENQRVLTPAQWFNVLNDQGIHVQLIPETPPINVFRPLVNHASGLG